MQFTQDAHEAVTAGALTVTFRLWKRPHAKVGGRYGVGPVVVEVDAIDLVPFGAITRADVRRSGATDREALRRRAAHAGPIDDDTVLYRVAFHVVGAREPKPRVVADTTAVAAACVRLDRMDARAVGGPWTRDLLALIGERPGTVSAELATRLGRERAALKADVRRLKALGLTESLEVGYRLTRLGKAVVRADAS